MIHTFTRYTPNEPATYEKRSCQSWNGRVIWTCPKLKHFHGLSISAVVNHTRVEGFEPHVRAEQNGEQP
jgi:hypothetical protein